jgi:serine-type D-Ala-D-Ala carboxypeptidase (penicillin-binding protein 5/6)
MPGNTYKRYILISLAILTVMLAYLYLRPVPAVRPAVRLPVAPKAQTVTLPWPAGGQSSLGAEGYGVLATRNAGNPVPVGSTAKTITALAVLSRKPIKNAGQGPSITLDAADVALFNNYYSQGGSVTQVSVGEQITELQALQSMLLPSSNNMADSLAKWAFGSIDAYLSYANRMVKNLGLRHTTVGDTNGFSDTTTSTADDMVRLGLAAMENPAITQVVSQSASNVPVAGDIKNLNILIGQDGIYGIKTGFTDKAGGCYLFAARHTIDGQKVTLVGATLGQATLVDALTAAPPILKAANSDFEAVTPVHKGQTVALYKSPWNTSAKLVSSQNISVLRWRGQEIRVQSEFDSIPASAKAGDSFGNIIVISGEHKAASQTMLAQDLPGPSLAWRLFR